MPNEEKEVVRTQLIKIADELNQAQLKKNRDNQEGCETELQDLLGGTDLEIIQELLPGFTKGLSNEERNNILINTFRKPRSFIVGEEDTDRFIEAFEDFASRYNGGRDKDKFSWKKDESGKTSIHFPSLDATYAFMGDSAAKNIAFECYSIKPDGTRGDLVAYSKGDGKLYGANGNEITNISQYKVLLESIISKKEPEFSPEESSSSSFAPR